MKAMAKHRTHSVEFKRQVSQEYLSGETLHGLAKRHNVSRNLIRIWVEKYQAGALDEDSLQPVCSRPTKRALLHSSAWLASRLSNWSV
jgi:transposase-like protein